MHEPASVRHQAQYEYPLAVSHRTRDPARTTGRRITQSGSLHTVKVQEAQVEVEPDYPVRSTSVTVEKHRGRNLLFVTAMLLPFAVLPLELGFGKIGLAVPIAALVLLVGIRHHVFDGGIITGVELAAAALCFWVFARLALLAPAAGEAIAWEQLVRDCGALLAGVILFRLARRDELQQTLLRALGVAFVLLILMEAYQLLAGLPALEAAGYTPANGFFYYTAGGAYRPFGTFTGPTTFGTFLAMLGMFMAFSGGRRVVLLVGAVTTVAVVITNTRAAWLGAGLALSVLALGSPEVRRRISALLIPALLVLALTLLVWTSVFVTILERMLSVTDPSDTSRQSRIALWEGVVHATSHHGAVFDGFGGGNWGGIMFPEVGQAVAGFGHAHSNYFQEWFRYGAIGMTLFIVFVLAMLVAAIRGVKARRRYALGALSAVVIFVVDSVFNNSLSSLNFVVMALLLLGMGAPARRQAQPLSSNVGLTELRPRFETPRSHAGETGVSLG